jgi:hypothetical protein
MVAFAVASSLWLSGLHRIDIQLRRVFIRIDSVASTSMLAVSHQHQHQLRRVYIRVDTVRVDTIVMTFESSIKIFAIMTFDAVADMTSEFAIMTFEFTAMIFDPSSPRSSTPPSS